MRGWGIASVAPDPGDLSPEHGLDLGLQALFSRAGEGTGWPGTQFQCAQEEIGCLLEVAQNARAFGQALKQEGEVQALFQRCFWEQRRFQRLAHVGSEQGWREL